MIQQKWICQTFWTKPMLSDENIQKNIRIAQLSLYYAKRSGYFVKMYTDSKGYEYLKKFNYDKLVKNLDNIPSDIPKEIFAYPKYIALKTEPLGVIHTDFDVFIKKPCLDVFYENSNYDVILQNRETKQQTDNHGYTAERIFFRYHNKPKDFPVNHYRASNVGVIGFNSKFIKDKYLNSYNEFVEHYKNIIPKTNFIADLFFEQINIDYIIEKYKANIYFLLPELDYQELELQKMAKDIGYQHLLGSWKYSEDGQNFIKKFVDTHLCDINSFNTKVIWAAPTSGKTYLCVNNKKYIDFDTIKMKHNINFNYDNYSEYIIKLHDLFINTIKNFNNSDKIILVSDVELLHSFYHYFSEIYVISYDKMLNNIINRDKERGIPNINENENVIWTDTIKSKIDFISTVREVKFIDTHLYDILK